MSSYDEEEEYRAGPMPMEWFDPPRKLPVDLPPGTFGLLSYIDLYPPMVGEEISRTSVPGWQVAQVVESPEGMVSTVPSREYVPPVISHGNWVGGDWSAGRRMRPGELMQPEDFRIQPIDGYDEAGYWHDFAYDHGWRELNRALADGYSNADALINFHYRAAEADRALAAEARRASANTWFDNKVIREWTPGLAENWAANRIKLIDELRHNSALRSYINTLSSSRLLDQTTNDAVGDQLDILRRNRLLQQYAPPPAMRVP